MTQMLKQGKAYPEHPTLGRLERGLGTREATRLSSWYILVTHMVALYFSQVFTTECLGCRKQMPAATRDSLTHATGV